MPLAAVPAAPRTQLREVTDQLASIDVTAIHSPPGATGTRSSGSGSVSPAPAYSAGIDAALHPVLMSVLHRLLRGALPAGSTSAVLLNLTPYGGSSRVYRRTRAVTADGSVTPTAYAESQRPQDHHLRETSAESFAVFITEPQTLRAMRPRVHAFFAALGTPRRRSSR